MQTHVIQVDGGSKVTLNRTGFEMSAASPLIDCWVQSYDGKHPLLDIGRAFGRNTEAAVRKIHSSMGTPKTTTPQVVAVDCDDRHLQAVDALKLTGVKTLFGRLPGDFPSKEAIGGSSSGILISAVLHFLKGEDIESSIQSAHNLLVSGSKLVLSTVSFNFKPAIWQ